MEHFRSHTPPAPGTTTEIDDAEARAWIAKEMMPFLGKTDTKVVRMLVIMHAMLNALADFDAATGEHSVHVVVKMALGEIEEAEDKWRKGTAIPCEGNA